MAAAVAWLREVPLTPAWPQVPLLHVVHSLYVARKLRHADHGVARGTWPAGCLGATCS
jgi:hypothetical protein